MVLALAMAFSDRGTDWVSATVIVPPSVQRQFTGASGAPGQPAERVDDPRVTRKVYPMSVIPGGAYSVAELKEYVAKDPVAKRSFNEHAKRLNDPDLLSHLKVRRVTKPIKMHTQLREGDKLFASSKPVIVQPGEAGFFREESDELVARARCGNVMFVTPPAGVPPRPAPGPAPQQQQQQETVGGAPGERPPAPVPPLPPSISIPVSVPPAPLPAIPPPCPPQPAPVVVCPPPCPPTPAPPVPPPPPPPPVTAVAKGFSLPWWAFLAALPPIVDVHQHQQQQQKMKQKQQQKQKQKQKQSDQRKPPRPPKPPHPPTPPDVCIPKTPDAIPEPGTMVLMGLGLAGASLLAHRRRRSRQ